MPERERLINLLSTAGWNLFTDEGSKKQIADHLLANGVIVPPVEIGQTVWYIKGGYYNAPYKKPRPIEVTEINKKWHGKILDWGFIANGTRYRFTSIGKTVFLSREEAEKALKERSEIKTMGGNIDGR